MTSKGGLLCGACSIAWLIAVPGWAQVAQEPPADRSATALEEVVVTARRREEVAQETPVSVTAVGGEALDRANVKVTADLANVVPGLVISEPSSQLSGATAFIRGIGAGETSMAVDSPVGMYRDGIYLGFNTLSGNDELTTIERVEVLRGPQGTLFGRNTTGGAINIVTRAPRTEFGVSQIFRYGNYDALGSITTVDSGPIGGTGLSAVVSFSHQQRDGYVDDPTRPDSYDPGAFVSNSVFLKVRGEWGRFTADYVFDNRDLKGAEPVFQITVVSPLTGAYFGASRNYGGAGLVVSTRRLDAIDQLDQPKQRSHIYGHALTAELDVSEALKLKSITAWRRFDGRTLSFQAGNAGLLGLTTSSLTAPVPIFVFKSEPRQFTWHHFTQEVQAVGRVGSLGYTVGAFYLEQKGAELNVSNLIFPVAPVVGFPVAAPSQYEIANKSTAVFGQVDYSPEFLSQLELSGGIRYTKDRKRVAQTLPLPMNGRETFDNTTYLLSAKYQWTPEIMTFARWSTGFRAGGFNIRAGAGQDFVYRPERATTIEAGLKSEFLDRRVRFNAGLFRTKYEDLQVTTLTGIAEGNLGGQTYNADATYKGGEAELAMIPFRGLTLFGNVGYVDPSYKQIFFNDPVTNLPRNYADEAKFGYVPKWNGNAGVEYEFPRMEVGVLSAQVRWAYVGKRYFHLIDLPTQSPFNEEIAQGGYGVWSARVTLSEVEIAGKQLQLSAWVENLTNREYRVSGIDFGSTGFAGNSYARPRMFGIDLRIDM